MEKNKEETVIMNKNVLFSTTRQWNPGDEFILIGTINLLKEIIGDFNPIIFNRNPEVRQYKNINPFRHSKYCNISFRGKQKLESFFRIGFWDNSFKNEMDLDFIDMVVFAGSPEWIEGILDPLYEKLQNYKKPILYLGIGSGRFHELNKINSLYLNVLKKAKIITVRDTFTYNLLKPFNPIFMPCPALFSCSDSDEKEIKKVKKIGLIFATDKAVKFNKIDTKTYKYLLNLYNKLLSKYNCEIVCHYIEEVPEAYNLYKDKDVNIHYSYDSKDYIDIYKRFDLIIGTRVHGIGMSASMGIPGILISHDLRADTGKGFLADIVSNEDINGILQKIITIENNIKNLNKNLLEYKKLKKKEFLNLLIHE